MTAAAKHLDPIVGLDIHIVQPPGPVPPLPIPHPHTGLICDPFDYLPILGSTVKVGGLHRALGGSVGVMMPPHFPIGGMFVKPPANDSEVLMGSSTVRANGDVLSRLAMPMLSCSDIGMPPIPRLKKKKLRLTLSLPTTFTMSIPSGVNVGGPPTISVMAIVMRAGIGALRKIAGKAKKAWKARKAKRQNGRCANGLDPVDLISGAVFDSFVDLHIAPLKWERHYSTSRARQSGPLGYGFRHSYQYELRVFRQAIRLTLPTGEQLLLPPLRQDADEYRGDGVRLRRVSSGCYELFHHQTCYRFDRTPDGRNHRLGSVQDASGHQLHITWRGNDLDHIDVQNDQGTVRFRVVYDERGRIEGLARLDATGLTPWVEYHYDNHDNLITSQDAEGGRFSYQYDAGHRWTSKCDPRGYRYSWRYDEEGRCVEGGGEDGLWHGTIAYSPAHRETRVTQRGATWLYRYDENETVVEVIDPMGGARRRILDEAGRVQVDIDAGDRCTQWIYDESGSHIANVDRFGHVVAPDDDDPTLLERPMPECGQEWCFGKRVHYEAAVPGPVRYDNLGRQVQRDDSCGASYRASYDSAGNLLSAQDRDGRIYANVVDSWNLIVAERDPLAHATRYEYSAREQVTRIVDPGGTTSEYLYDAKDRLIQVCRHNKLRDEYRYDAGDRLLEKRDGQGRLLLRLEYNEQCLVSVRYLASGGSHFFRYDARGALTRASTDEVEVDIGRTEWGQRTHDRRDGIGVEHTYDSGTLRRTSVLERFATTYDYDAVSGQVAITDPTGRQHRLEVQDALVAFRTHPNGSSERVEFDREGRTVHTTAWSAPEPNGRSTRYAYSREGDLLSIEDSAGNHARYHWDEAHRLVGEESTAGYSPIALDSAGNLLRMNGLANVVLSDGNRLLHANAESFTYNERDHIAKRQNAYGRTIHHLYDALDQLIAIVDESRRGFWTATYDGIGRRVRAGFANGQREFYWDENRLAAELSAEGKLRIYVYADEHALVPLAFIDYESIEADPSEGQLYVLFTNHIGMPTRVEDAAGNVAWRAARIDAYGTVEVEDGASIELNLRWPGHYFDPESGLHYNRFRYYDPQLGRYLQSDPAGTEGGINLYAYVPDPVSNVDLLGLAGCGEKLNSVWARIGSSRMMEGVRQAGRKIKSWFTRRPKHPGQLVDDLLDARVLRLHGDEAARAAAKADLRRIADTPMGQELLENLRKSGRHVDIHADPRQSPHWNTYEARGPHCRPTADHQGSARLVNDPNGDLYPRGEFVDRTRPVRAKPGKGSDSDVVYDPLGRHPGHGNTPANPSDNTLFHELVHAENAARGRGLSKAAPKDDMKSMLHSNSAEELDACTRENAYLAYNRTHPRNPRPELGERRNHYEPAQVYED